MGLNSNRSAQGAFAARAAGAFGLRRFSIDYYRDFPDAGMMLSDLPKPEQRQRRDIAARNHLTVDLRWFKYAVIAWVMLALGLGALAWWLASMIILLVGVIPTLPLVGATLVMLAFVVAWVAELTSPGSL